MARVDQGSTAIQQQPGAKLVSDGYGLLTATVTWKGNPATLLSSVCNRGGTCPLNAALTSHKYSLSYEALGLGIATVDYVGIDPSYYSGARTEPQITGTQGLTSEHISTHPNFFNTASGYSSPIASAPPYTLSALGPTSGGASTYEGTNGACFEKEDGGRFIGFIDPGYPDYFGKTNYLAPTSSISGHFYTTSTTNIVELKNRVGKTSGTNTFYGIPLIPSYIGTSFTNGSKNQMLLSQIGFEDYGSLYKIHYEIRYNREGYNRLTYLDA